jgi:hypothetical protein
MFNYGALYSFIIRHPPYGYILGPPEVQRTTNNLETDSAADELATEPSGSWPGASNRDWGAALAILDLLTLHPIR